MAARRAQPANTLERKIFFFRADVGVDAAGAPVPFNPAPALRVISGLRFQGDPNRYVNDDDGNALCGWTVGNVSPNKFIFGRIRRTGLPQQERAGAITDLNIAADAGLVEASHIMFFPNNIMGMEYNHFGPRASRLGFYLRTKSANAVPLATFHPLLRQDVAAQLDRLTDLRLFEMKIRPAYGAIVRQADQSLGAAFEANARAIAGAESLELVARIARGSRGNALQSIDRTLRRLLRRGDMQENTLSLSIRGRTNDSGRVETIDLLKDQLIARKQIMRVGERSRALSADSAFEQIAAAYEELKDNLEAAAAVE